MRKLKNVGEYVQCRRCKKHRPLRLFRVDDRHRVPAWCSPCRETGESSGYRRHSVHATPGDLEIPSGTLPPPDLPPPPPADGITEADTFACLKFNCRLTYGACLGRMTHRVKNHGRGADGKLHDTLSVPYPYCAFQCLQGAQNMKLLGKRELLVQIRPAMTFGTKGTKG